MPHPPVARPILWSLVATLMTGHAPAQAAPDPASATEGLDAGVPTRWQEAVTPARQPADDATLVHWWQQFQDPQLSALIQAALDRNPDLRSARATLAQAEASRAVIAAGGQPQLSTPASASRNRVDSSNSKLYKVGVSASWELDWNHAIDTNIRAADATLRSAAQDLATARMVITSDVAVAYFQWRGAQWRQRVAQANLTSLEETRQLVDWKAQAGLLSQLDQDQARQSAEQTRAALVALGTEVAQDEHLLALLTGRTPADLAGQLGDAPGWPGTDELIARLRVGVPADLLRRRPDLRSAEAKVQAQWYSMVKTRQDGDATFALTGSLGLQSTALKALISRGAALVTGLGLNIDWPIWEGGKRQALIAEQKAAWGLSRASYESTLLGAVQDVEDALVATRDSVDRCQALQAATDAAQRVVDTQRQRHEAGLIDTATLLDSQRTLLGLQTSLATARTDQAQALVRLYKSLGGGWSQDDIAVATPAPPPSDNPLSALFRNEP